MSEKLNTAESIFLELLSSSIHYTPVSDLSLHPDEWNAVFTLARAHNVLPLVFEKASEDENFTALPEYQQHEFETMSIVAGQARRTEAFLSLYKELLKADVHPIVMKGLICRQLYGEYCDHRPSGDEDILIRKEEYKQVEKILVENGYTPENENVTPALLDEVQEITFYSGQTGLSIEVHVNPIGHEYGLRRQLNDCFRDVL